MSALPSNNPASGIPAPTARRIGTTEANAELVDGNDFFTNIIVTANSPHTQHVTITIDGKEHKFSGSGSFAKLGRISLDPGYKKVDISFSYEKDGVVKPSIGLDIVQPFEFSTKRNALYSAENGESTPDEDDDDYDDCEVRFVASVPRPVDRTDG